MLCNSSTTYEGACVIKKDLELLIKNIEEEKFFARTALEKELFKEIILNLKFLLKIKENGLYNGIYKDLQKTKRRH